MLKNSLILCLLTAGLPAAWPEGVGQSNGERFGRSVAGAGDVNGDGYTDVIVGAYTSDSGGRHRGKAYLYLGSANGLGKAAKWNQGVGESDKDSFGVCVAGAGDVNGDGFDDVIVGAYEHNGKGSKRGKAYLYLGSAEGLAKAKPWPQGVGEADDDYFGYSVAGAGDVNGDGFDDVIVGAQQHGSMRGKAYLYLGSVNGLAKASPWPQGIGEAEGDEYGISVAGAGDVNGDGYADVLVGAYAAAGGGSRRGKAYLYLGTRAGLGAASQWPEGVGNADRDRFGVWVSGAGDVNSDGYDDAIIGSYNSNKAYLYLGADYGLGAPSQWPQAVGEAEHDYFGRNVAAAGDVNGDGYDDVIVGAQYQAAGGKDRGKAYLYLGGDYGLGAARPWPEAVGEADGDRFGMAVAGAGDVNGDGLDDVVVGAFASNAGGPKRGKAYLFLGKEAPSLAP